MVISQINGYSKEDKEVEDAPVDRFLSRKEYLRSADGNY
jgi:hypothetical protein